MSGTPKRSHDDASSLKYTHEEFGSSYPRVSTSASADFNQSFESSDGRPGKMPRSEPREADKRSHLHPSYRVPTLPSDTTPDTHHAPTEGKIKEGIEQRGDNRDPRIEFKEPHVERKRDSTSKLDDIKDATSDREPLVGPKNEKEGLNVAGFPMMMNWKDSKESLRGKKYSESQSVVIDTWPSVRSGSRTPMDFRKETGSVESSEPKEAVGENKVDVKGDEKYKEKDRKKKEIKLREWGDGNKEKLERRSSLQDGKEANKEDKEGDEERKKDKEKEQHKSGAHEKEQEEGLPKEQDGSYVEQRKQKEGDHFKNVDKEGKEKRKERDHNADSDKMEKKGRVLDKEVDDSCVDNELTSEKDENHNYAAQPRKRILWPKGSPQMGNHEPRAKPRAQDHDGVQAKPEVSSVVYKVGECMQDLIKMWREYEQSRSEKTPDFGSNGPTLEIRIPAEHVTATNRQVRGGQLWGTDIYTDDSDLVAVLMHTGYCRPTAAPPPSAILELRATIRVLPPQDSYTSMLRNNVRSRSWGAGIACSYRVERCFIVKKGGGNIELEPCLTHTSAVEPTLAPVAVERTMTTRAAASNALRQQRFVREVTIQYNLCNEPWIKYSISVIADKGLKKSLFTSARLKKGEVLYLETHTCRYELCYNGEEHASNGDRNESDGSHADTFRWSRCKKALPQKVMRSVGIPLPLEYLEVIEENVDWEDVQWSQTGVWVAGKEYFLARSHFLSPS